MKFRQAFAAVALSAAIFGAAAPAFGQLAEGVAVIVNDRVISTYDVRVRAHMLLVSAGIEATPEMMERARAQALQDLIDEQLQMQEAARFEITVSPQTIDGRIADIAQQNEMSPEQFIQQLSAAGVSIAMLRRQIEAEIAWQRLMVGLYQQRLRISDTEVRETQARLAQAATRPQYLISEIFLPATTEQEFQQMENGGARLIQEMQRGAPFPLVARQFSQSPSAAAGGDIGWIAASELAPELQPVAERLQVGQVSLPVRTPTGVYIIALRDRRAGAAAGTTSVVTLRQVVAPIGRRSALERLQGRIESCGGLEREANAIDGASVVDLGMVSESDLSPDTRSRISGVAAGRASQLVIDGETVNIMVVCTREAGGAGVPSRDEIEMRLRERELNMLSERYLRNLRREASYVYR
jgi:peptidyl-prolyl cis-trans isomerase SurA